MPFFRRTFYGKALKKKKKKKKNYEKAFKKKKKKKKINFLHNHNVHRCNIPK